MDQVKSADWQLVQDAKGDPKGFELLYVKYYEALFRFVFKRMERFEDSEEITASVFIKAFSNITKYEDRGFLFSSWLYRVAINEINQYYKQNKKLRFVSLSENSLDKLAEETAVPQVELDAKLQKALQTLNPEEMECIQLRFFEGKSFAELGAILDITENNAKVKTYRIIDKLKKVMIHKSI